MDFSKRNAFTPALGKYYTLDIETEKPRMELIYGKKNSVCVQPYHRLDQGFSHATTTRRGNKAVWTFSIYNAYNHINPFAYYYDNDMSLENEPYYERPLQLYKIGIFTIFPSIAYKVYFDYTKRPEKTTEKRTEEI